MLQHRGVITVTAHPPQQAQPRAHLCAEAGVAPQLADIYQRNRTSLPLESLGLRKQHDYLAPTVRGGVRLLRRANDLVQDAKSEANNVLRVLADLPIVPGDLEYSHSAQPSPSDPRNPTSILQLDSIGVYFRDTTHLAAAYAVLRGARIPECHFAVFDGDWWSANRRPGWQQL